MKKIKSTLLLFLGMSLVCVTSFSNEKNTLKSFIEEALQNSPYLKLQEKNVNAKDADVQIARANFFPHVQGEFTRDRQSDENYFTDFQKKRFEESSDTSVQSINTKLDQDIVAWAVDVKQDIFKGFGNVNNYREKKRIYDISVVEQKIEKNNLIYDITSTYIDLLNLSSQLSFLQKALKSALEQEKHAKRKYELQTISEAELLKAQEKSLEISWKLHEAKQTNEISKNKLNQLLGKPLDQEIEPEPLKLKTAQPKSLSDYLKEAEQNLDLQRAQLKLKKNRHKKQLTYAQHLLMPNLGFNFNYEQRGKKMTDLKDGWKFGASLKVPLFDGLENFGEKNKAQAGIEAALVEENLLHQKTHVEIKQHYYAWQSLEQKLQFLNKKRQRQQKRYDDVIKSYKEKAATLAQLHAIEVLVQEVETELLTTKRMQFLNILALQKLTGEIYVQNLF
ncbi:MAG: hypothetical protein A3B70_07345 [Deltaproteobacteria bacterium RIFCSPHIGHO2_02_FULL_40_11]|nr:MAG: hypothetical protein A3B70_07345 [Deltaproteobacteria bacterium RIFCSPHIGHO2_02_FULL_40_11]